LLDYNLSRHGLISTLQSEIGCHRHTIRKLLNNEASSISLNTLSGLCEWLQREGNVPAELLPQVLFGYRPEKLWQAVSQTGQVTIYLGEYQQTEPPLPTRLWVSRRDAAVASAIVEELYVHLTRLKRPPSIRHGYVPFRLSMHTPETRTRYFKEDTRRAKRIFRGMRSQTAQGASIFIGSQEVNYIVECWVASLFGCKPFEPSRNGPQVPFYVKSRHKKSGMKSCFGGVDDPPGCSKQPHPGIFYLDKSGKWAACRMIDGKQDAGLVIIVRHPGANAIEVAMFGVSGRATAAMVKHVVRSADPFWPPYFKRGGKEIGVYICKFIVAPDTEPQQDGMYGMYQIKDFQPIPLEKEVLSRFVRQNV
jgi:hypothetical protein